ECRGPGREQTQADRQASREDREKHRRRVFRMIAKNDHCAINRAEGNSVRGSANNPLHGSIQCPLIEKFAIARNKKRAQISREQKGLQGKKASDTLRRSAVQGCSPGRNRNAILQGVWSRTRNSNDLPEMWSQPGSGNAASCRSTTNRERARHGWDG